jgi:hypothetical protein
VFGIFMGGSLSILLRVFNTRRQANGDGRADG